MAPKQTSDKTRPNVVIIITDDQGYGDLGCHGNPVAVTPNLDALHDQSVRFGDFHAAPMCTPTRGQLLTGTDAARNGAVNVSSGRTLLRADLPTMADVFRNAGYRTGLFGKWHLGDNYPYRPEDRGFEETLWFPSSHISSLPDYWQNDYFDDVYCRNGTRERVEGYCTEVFFRDAKAWMKKCIDQNEPFFTYLPTNAPHAPWYVPAEDREVVAAAFAAGEKELPKLERPREDIVRFLAMIRTVDTQVGKLREFLATEGVDRDTVLIFMTDNGSTFGPAYYNAGMRGGKCTLWEGGHRVPCFIHWPNGNLGEPRDIDGITQMQDLLPTLSDLCNAPLDDTPIDGISLAEPLRGAGTVPEDRMVAVNYSRMPSFDYPTPVSQAVMRREGAAVMWKRWRLIEGTALYDLDTDPAQETNVIEQFPDIARKMTQGLDDWWADVEDTANEPREIIIGSDHENPMMLTGCEWWDVFLDQQNQVRRGCHKNSYWHLQVAQAGRYRFELRRWPRESNLKLREASPPAKLTDGELDAGVSLPIARARITVGGQTLSRDATREDCAGEFVLDLEQGSTLLHTWFDDDRGEPICGAYYAYVERLADK